MPVSGPGSTKVPKYQQIKQYFLEQIRSGKLPEDSRIPSEKRLAEELDVSPLTVAKALGQLEDEGYVIRRVGDGTYVQKFDKHTDANPFKLAAEGYVAMLINSMSFGIIPHLIHQIEKRLSKIGFHVVIKSLNHSFEDTLSAVDSIREEQDLCAFVFTPIHSLLYETDNFDLYQEIQKLGKPVLMVDEYLKTHPCYCVSSDNFQGSYDAVKYLLSKGHRQIGLLWNRRNSATADRIEGYCRALNDAHIAFQEEYVRQCHYDPFDRTGKNLLEDVLQDMFSLKNPPTAIFALDDYMARYTKYYCIDQKIQIPEQVALIGFDDFLPSQMTKVRQNVDRIAEETVQMLLCLLSGKTPEKSQIFVPTELILRDST